MVNDKLFGQSGNDTLSGENGQNILHGGTDSDTAKFTGKADDYTVEKHHGFVKVINKADPSKSTLVVNSETLQFGDASVAVESAPALNALAGMYQKVLGRQADIDGFDYFGDLQAKGGSMGSMALNMMKTAEGQARGWVLTGDPVNDVEMLYQALLGRNADAGGKAAWVQLLKSGSVSLDQVATAFVESLEMKPTILAQRDGISWCNGPWDKPREALMDSENFFPKANPAKSKRWMPVFVGMRFFQRIPR